MDTDRKDAPGPYSSLKSSDLRTFLFATAFVRTPPWDEAGVLEVAGVERPQGIASAFRKVTFELESTTTMQTRVSSGAITRPTMRRTAKRTVR